MTVSKAYRRVVDDQPYGPDYDIRKEECVGHVQKRMGPTCVSFWSPKKVSKLGIYHDHLVTTGVHACMFACENKVYLALILYHWRHYDIITVASREHHGVYNERQLHCSFNCVFMRTLKKASKLSIIGPLWGENHRWIPHKGPLMRKMGPWHDVIMYMNYKFFSYRTETVWWQATKRLRKTHSTKSRCHASVLRQIYVTYQPQAARETAASVGYTWTLQRGRHAPALSSRCF